MKRWKKIPAADSATAVPPYSSNQSARALLQVGGVDRHFRVGAFQVSANDLGVGDVEVAVDQRRYFAEWAYPGQFLIA